MTFDCDELAHSITSKSIYKQPFCYFGLRCMPEAFINTKSEYLQEILMICKHSINNDDKFGKIIYTYLCYPSYFSIYDYDILLDSFKSISYDIQLNISTNIFDKLFACAIKNVTKYEHGIYNLCNFISRLPFVIVEESLWLNKVLLNILFKHKDLIECPEKINDFVLKMINVIYGSIDDYIELHINDFTIEI